jgi:hypothetical protein
VLVTLVTYFGALKITLQVAVMDRKNKRLVLCVYVPPMRTNVIRCSIPRVESFMHDTDAVLDVGVFQALRLCFKHVL